MCGCVWVCACRRTHAAGAACRPTLPRQTSLAEDVRGYEWIVRFCVTRACVTPGVYVFVWHAHAQVAALQGSIAAAREKAKRLRDRTLENENAFTLAAGVRL